MRDRWLNDKKNCKGVNVYFIPDLSFMLTLFPTEGSICIFIIFSVLQNMAECSSLSDERSSPPLKVFRKNRRQGPQSTR